jgi:plastocyanin
MTQNTKTVGNEMLLRWSVIIAIAAIALFGSYRFAQARGNAAQASGTAIAAAATGAAGAGAANGTGAVAGAGGCCGGGSAAAGTASGAGGCCGGGAKNAPATSKQAAVAGSVQKISVDVSKGYYDPSTIQLKAGVPAEITFGQGSGCTGTVQSQQLGFSEDISAGPKTVKLAGLQPGTYQFACGMNMVFGSIVVK